MNQSKYKGNFQISLIFKEQQTLIRGGNLSHEPYIFWGNFFQIIEFFETVPRKRSILGVSLILELYNIL